jgi:hypothetical protein
MQIYISKLLSMSRKLSMKWGQEEKITVNKLRFVILRSWSPQAPPEAGKLDRSTTHRGNPDPRTFWTDKLARLRL